MDKINIKLNAYQYAVIQLVKWEEAFTGKKNTISRLKSLLLIYFLVARTSAKNKPSFLLNNVFDNLHAQPYGSLEQDIMDYLMTKKEFTNIKINDNLTEIIDEFVELDIKIKVEIDKAIDELRETDKEFITMPPFSLMDLNQLQYSWAKTYRDAVEAGSHRKKIDNELIIIEDKTFHLTIF